MLTRALVIAALVFVLDRASKFWIVEVLDLKNVYFIEVVDPFLNLTMAWNRGINFGLFDMGDAGRWVLIALALAIVVAVLVWLRGRDDTGSAVGAGLVVGGALGNVWDRVQYGAVADFLNMSCCGIRNPFAFNIADAAIFAGVVVLFVFVRDRADDGPDRSRDGA
jgi:signal peptidase II